MSVDLRDNDRVETARLIEIYARIADLGATQKAAIESGERNHRETMQRIDVLDRRIAEHFQSTEARLREADARTAKTVSELESRIEDVDKKHEATREQVLRWGGGLAALFAASSLILGWAAFFRKVG